MLNRIYKGKEMPKSQTVDWVSVIGLLFAAIMVATGVILPGLALFGLMFFLYLDKVIQAVSRCAEGLEERKL